MTARCFRQSIFAVRFTKNFVYFSYRFFYTKWYSKIHLKNPFIGTKLDVFNTMKIMLFTLVQSDMNWISSLFIELLHTYVITLKYTHSVLVTPSLKKQCELIQRPNIKNKRSKNRQMDKRLPLALGSFWKISINWIVCMELSFCKAKYVLSVSSRKLMHFIKQSVKNTSLIVLPIASHDISQFSDSIWIPCRKNDTSFDAIQKSTHFLESS